MGLLKPPQQIFHTKLFMRLSFDLITREDYTTASLVSLAWYRRTKAGMDLANASQAYRLISAQLVTTLIAALLLILFGWVHVWSGLIGGLIATLTNAVFAARVFVRYRAQEPARLLGRFYGAELIKLVLTALLFAGVFIWLEPLSPGALFGVFLLVQITPMLAVQILD